MKRFLRILALVLLGFALGGGAAYLTQMHKYRAQQGMSQPATSTTVAPLGGDVEITQGPDGRLKASHHPKKHDGTAAPDSSSGEESAGEKMAGKNSAEERHDGDDITGASADDSLTGTDAPAARTVPHVSPTIGLYVPGTFSLKDQNGNDVTEKSWPGKYLLVFFGFTHCPDICPVTLEKITAMLGKLGPLADKVQPLFITIDPARDTPAVLKDYLSHYHKSFIGLTGTEAQVKSAEESFKVYAKPIPGRDEAEYTFDHSAFVYLMSPRNVLEEVLRVEQPTEVVLGKVRPYLDGTGKPKVLTP